MEVRFADGCGIDDSRDRDEIIQVLSRVAAGEGGGRSSGTVHGIDVLRRLSGSRSGAEVLEIKVSETVRQTHGGVQLLTRLQVAKLDRADRVARDWHGYARFFDRFDTACCTAVTAVTSGVTDGTTPKGERGAVFYQHVGERAGEPDAVLSTLEQLAAAALEGGEREAEAAEDGVRLLLGKLGNTLHKGAAPSVTHTMMSWLNPRLGPDLVLEVNAFRDGGLYFDDPGGPEPFRADGPRVSRAACHYSDSGEEAMRFAPGAGVTVNLDDLRPPGHGVRPGGGSPAEGGILIGRAPADVRVEIRLAPALHGRLPAGGFGSVSTPVQGRVVGTRARLHWATLRELLGADLVHRSDPPPFPGSSGGSPGPYGSPGSPGPSGPPGVPGDVLLGGRPLGHPFARLREILHDPGPRWISSFVHGDLNPRNVLFVSGQPFLIDYAEAAEDHPLLGDFAWLETGLTRDVIAPRLSYEELVSLCRVLAVASRCPGRRPPRVWACAGRSPAFTAAFRLLWAVRDRAREAHGRAARAQGEGEERREWWREYLEQVTLAACRTLKWPAAFHNRDTAAAAVALAGVAGEFLGGGAGRPGGAWTGGRRACGGDGARGGGHPDTGPLRRFDTARLHGLATGLLPGLPVTEPAGLSLFAEIVGCLDARRTAPDPPAVAEAVERARAAVVGELCREEAEAGLRRLRRRSRSYITLRGRMLDARHTRDPGPVAGPGRSGGPGPAREPRQSRGPDAREGAGTGPAPGYGEPVAEHGPYGDAGRYGSYDAGGPYAGYDGGGHGGGYDGGGSPYGGYDGGPGVPYGPFGSFASAGPSDTYGDALAQVASLPAVAVLGEAGAGKTTLVRELAILHASAAAGEDGGGGGEQDPALRTPPRLPLVVSAADLAPYAGSGPGTPEAEPERGPAPGAAAAGPDGGREGGEPGGDRAGTGPPLEFAGVLRTVAGLGGSLTVPVCADLLVVGGLHLSVDGLNELTGEQRDRVVDWLLRLRRSCPRTRLVVCHRSFDFPSDGLPLPTVTLQKVTPGQARRYIAGRLHATPPPQDVEDPVAQLTGWLFGDVENHRLRELTETPLFLWMTVEWYVFARTVPDSVGELFVKFTEWYLKEAHHAEDDHPEEPGAAAGGTGAGNGAGADVRAGRTGPRGAGRGPGPTGPVPAARQDAPEAAEGSDGRDGREGREGPGGSDGWDRDRERGREPGADRRDPDLAAKLGLLSAIAAHLVEQGNVTRARREHVETLLAAEGPPGWKDVLDDVIASEMLQEQDGSLRFLHQLFQEYFAARTLESCAAGRRRQRVLTFAWQEPARMLLSLPGTGPETVREILDTAGEAHPGYTAWLLRGTPSPPAAVVGSFLARRLAVLGAPQAGPRAWEESARALAQLRTAAGWQALAAVACDPGAAPGARAAAVRGLADARRELPHEGPGALDEALHAAVLAALAEGEGDGEADGTGGDPGVARVPDLVQAAALAAVGRARITAFGGLAWDRAHRDRPWPVVREAFGAVTALDMVISGTVRRARLDACAARLEAAGAELPLTADASTAAALNDERFALLGSLAEGDRLELLLGHRFSPGLAHRPHWAGLLTAAARNRARVRRDDPLARLLLDPLDRGAALRAFAGADDTAATAAAHRLLVDGAVPPRELIGLVDEDSSASRLQAAAAVVEGLGPAELARVESLVRTMIGSLAPGRPDRLAALASLVAALGQPSHLLRVELAHTAHRTMEERGISEAMYWPWSLAWHDAVVDDADLVQLLEQDGTGGHTVALRYLGGVEFLLSADARPPELRLSARARARLHAMRPVSPEGREAAEYVMAAAYAGLSGALDFITETALADANQRTVIRHSNTRHGVVEVTLADHAVSAIGYFGRLAREDKRHDAAAGAADTLLNLDTRGRPPSLERARLVGLGLLGKYEGLLLRLAPGDTVTHAAAANLIAQWEPVPWLNAEDRIARIGDVVTRQLASARSDPPVVREVLAGIKADLESRLGRYVPGGNPDGPGGGLGGGAETGAGYGGAVGPAGRPARTVHGRPPDTGHADGARHPDPAAGPDPDGVRERPQVRETAVGERDGTGGGEGTGEREAAGDRGGTGQREAAGGRPAAPGRCTAGPTDGREDG